MGVANSVFRTVWEEKGKGNIQYSMVWPFKVSFIYILAWFKHNSPNYELNIDLLIWPPKSSSYRQ